MTFEMISATMTPAIKDSAAFEPLRLQDTLNALYISATIQIINKRPKRDNTMKEGVIELIISSSVFGVVAGTCIPNPIMAGNTITQRAKAIVPAISIKRMEEPEAMRPAI